MAGFAARGTRRLGAKELSVAEMEWEGGGYKMAILVCCKRRVKLLMEACL